GIGMLRALGARTEPPDALHGVRRIDLSTMDARLKETRLTVASDVDNPLCGPAGASRVFGPQKGATPDDVARLDAALAQTADAMAAAIGRDLRDERGAGAAGGAGFALMAIGGKIRPGVDIVAELRGLPKALKGSGLCVTGEGAIDAQTLHGKTISGVGRYASQTGVPVIAFAGAIDAGAETELWKHGIACVSITAGPMRLEDAMRDAETLLTAAAARAVRLLLLEEERL
ncbi:MAG: glycerate kinase, partial [Vulcanimicrobiaceae bacterium]